MDITSYCYFAKRGKVWTYKFKNGLMSCYKSTLETDRTEAEAYAQWKYSRLYGDPADKLTLAEFAKDFYTKKCPRTMRKLASNSLTDRTRRRNRVSVEKHILTDELAKKPMRSISGADVEKIGGRWKASGVPGTVIDANLSVLRTIFNYAYKLDVVNRNPFLSFERYHSASQTEEGKCITIDHLQKLFPDFDPRKPVETQLGPWKSLEKRLCLFMCVELGVRRGEVLALKWHHINWKDETIYIKEAVKDDVITSELGTPKSRKGREAAMSEDLVALLKVYRAYRPMIHPKNRDYIFCGTPGIRRGFTWFWTAFKHAQEAVGLVENGKHIYKPHDCRHTAVTMQLAAGNAPSIVAKSIGHESAAIQARYTHHLKEQMIAARKKTKEYKDKLKQA